MTKPKNNNSLTEDQQTAIALDWFSAMWENAIERGVTPELMAIVCVSATSRKLLDVYGKDQAAILLGTAFDNITHDLTSATSINPN